MKDYIIKANIWETQSILYFILGVLILNLGTFKWVGWLCVGYGFLTMIGAIFVVFFGSVKEKIQEKLDQEDN